MLPDGRRVPRASHCGLPRGNSIDCNPARAQSLSHSSMRADHRARRRAADRILEVTSNNADRQEATKSCQRQAKAAKRPPHVESDPTVTTLRGNGASGRTQRRGPARHARRRVSTPRLQAKIRADSHGAKSCKECPRDRYRYGTRLSLRLAREGAKPGKSAAVNNAAVRLHVRLFAATVSESRLKEADRCARISDCAREVQPPRVSGSCCEGSGDPDRKRLATPPPN